MEDTNGVTQSNAWAIREIEKERQKYGGKCQWADLCPDETCEETIELQFAHIKPTELSGNGRGSYKRLQDIRNHPKCYKLLCDIHHRRYDGRKEKDDDI